MTQYLGTGELERVEFGDGKTFVMNDPIVGQAFRLYQAVFSRTADEEGLGYWTDVLDRGASLTEVALGFTESEEFFDRYAENSTHSGYVQALYTNILGRSQDEEGATFWVDHLSNGRLQPHEVLVAFAESPENAALVSDVLDEGVWFVNV